MDGVDKILAQWNRERPDLDVGPMGLIGRLRRISRYLTREMEKTFAAHGLNDASFDVLATLRRSGSPYGQSPGDLQATMMITSGTMTYRKPGRWPWLPRLTDQEGLCGHRRGGDGSCRDPETPDGKPVGKGQGRAQQAAAELPDDPKRALKNDKISSRAAIVGWPASSIR